MYPLHVVGLTSDGERDGAVLGVRRFPKFEHAIKHVVNASHEACKGQTSYSVQSLGYMLREAACAAR